MYSRYFESTCFDCSAGNTTSPAVISGPNRVELELEVRDDSEVPAASPDRPEQVGVLALVPREVSPRSP